MREEFYQHKRKDRVKWVFTFIALFLVFVMLIALCMQIFGNEKLKPENWFKKSEQPQPETPPEDNGGATVTDNETNSDGVKIKSRKLARSEYEENGISAQADTAFTLTATVLPEDAFDKSVDWTVSWQNGNSEWATGKNINDYYSITPTSDGALTANAVCSQAFAEPVIITCKLRENDISATVKADYVSKLLGMDYFLPAYEIDNFPDTYATYTPNWSIGTITGGTVTITDFSLSFPSEFGTVVDNVYNANGDYLDDCFACDIIFRPGDLQSAYDGDDSISQYFTDFYTFNSEASLQDKQIVNNAFRRALKDKYGQSVTLTNYLTYSIGYSYTIDGQTFTKWDERKADLIIDVYVSATSVSVNQTNIKH